MSQWWSEDSEAASATEAPAPPANPAPGPVAAGGVDQSTTAAGHTTPQPVEAATPTLLARSGTNAIVIGAVAGLIAGLAGVGLGAAFADSADTAPGIVVGGVAAVLGFLLNGWHHISAGYVSRGVRDGLVGAVISTAGGLVALLVADAVFHGIREDQNDVDAERIALMLGWFMIATIVGAGVGALQGPQKAISGTIGGAVGGLAGGAAFLALDGTREVDQAMLVGSMVAALVIGLAVGSVQRLRRQAWVRVIDGPLAGREIILYRSSATIGSSPHCDVALPGDEAVAAEHAVLDLGPPPTIQPIGGADVRVAGRATAGEAISEGAVVQIGATFLEVHGR